MGESFSNAPMASEVRWYCRLCMVDKAANQIETKISDIRLGGRSLRLALPRSPLVEGSRLNWESYFCSCVNEKKKRAVANLASNCQRAFKRLHTITFHTDDWKKPSQPDHTFCETMVSQMDPLSPLSTPNLPLTYANVSFHYPSSWA